jgi:hypothetical protein
MNNTKNKAVLILMVLAAIVSGCTEGGQTEDEGSTSLTVNEFSGFPNPVPANQNVQFRMQLVNDGDEDVDTAFARLYNPPFGGGAQVFSDENGDNPGKQARTLQFSDLRAEGDQTPAVPQTRQVDFQAPDLPRDRDLSYGFNADIFFGYETVGDAEIQILSEEAFREEGATQGSARLENSRAPIQLEVRTPTPIRIFDSQDSSVTKQFCVIARNQGQGTPFDPQDVPSSSDFNRVSIQDAEGEVEIGVQDVGSQVTFTADDGGGQTKTVEILQGKAVACFDMEISGVSNTFQTTVPIRVEADYGYKKTDNANLRVDGRGEASEVGGTTNTDGNADENTDESSATEFTYASGVDSSSSELLNVVSTYNGEVDSGNIDGSEIDPGDPNQACQKLQDFANNDDYSNFDSSDFEDLCDTA